MYVSTPGGEADPEHVIVSRWDSTTWAGLEHGTFHPWLNGQWGSRANDITIAAHTPMRTLHPDMGGDPLFPGGPPTLLSVTSMEVAIDMVYLLGRGDMPAAWDSVNLISTTDELSLREISGLAYDYATHAATTVEGVVAALLKPQPPAPDATSSTSSASPASLCTSSTSSCSR